MAWDLPLKIQKMRTRQGAAFLDAQSREREAFAVVQGSNKDASPMSKTQPDHANFRTQDTSV